MVIDQLGNVWQAVKHHSQTGGITNPSLKKNKKMMFFSPTRKRHEPRKAWNFGKTVIGPKPMRTPLSNPSGYPNFRPIWRSKRECRRTIGHVSFPSESLEDHPRTCKWLIIMISKSPNWGCSPYKWPTWLINGVINHLLTGMILQGGTSSNSESHFRPNKKLIARWYMAARRPAKMPLSLNSKEC